MTKMFNKEIKTPEQIQLYEAINANKREATSVEKLIRQSFKEYSDIEGKYANGKQDDPYTDGHFRSWFYTYAEESDKQKEREEQELYYKNIIDPLKAKLCFLTKEREELENKLCIALWGYGKEIYAKYQQLKADRKKLASLLEQVAFLEERISITEKELGGV
jgi:hypothetical protein